MAVAYQTGDYVIATYQEESLIRNGKNKYYRKDLIL